MKKDLLSLDDLTQRELQKILKLALAIKKGQKTRTSLKGKMLGLIFEKSSTRTRVSFEAAMFRLGGGSIYLEKQATQMGRGESYADTARVLSRYLDGLVLRAYSQKDLVEMALHAPIPVINGLTDMYHPCQVLADLMTLLELKKDLIKMKVAYVGDGNNMANSWIQAATILGFSLNLACPEGYGPLPELVQRILLKPHIRLTSSPEEAVSGCTAIVTDTWFSMGQEVCSDKKRAFEGFQVNRGLISHAHPQVKVLHCLPAHRGEEITDEVMDGPHSVVFNEAENRLYVQMALLELLLS